MMINTLRLRSIFLSLFTLFFIVACGPSEEEKKNIAIVTCNIIAESRNMDASVRIREINVAREKINEEPFLFRDNEIKRAIRLGLCENLVLNDPNYEILAQGAEELLREAERREKAIKQAELEKLKKARIRAEEIERNLELAKQAKLAIEKEERINELTAGLQEIFQKFPPKPRLRGISWTESNEILEVRYFCEGIYGLDLNVIVQFKNNLGIVSRKMGSCPGINAFCKIEGYQYCDKRYSVGKITSGKDYLTREVLDALYEYGTEIVEKITFKWSGSISSDLSKLVQIADKRYKRDLLDKVFQDKYRGLSADLTNLTSSWEVYPNDPHEKYLNLGKAYSPISWKAPKLPRKYFTAHPEGKIIVAFKITKDGNVKDPYVDDYGCDSPCDILLKSSLDAIKKFKFDPVISAGEIKEVKSFWIFNYEVEKRE